MNLRMPGLSGSLIAPTVSFEASRGSLDAAVVHERSSYMRNLRLQDERDVFVEDRNGVSPTHRQGSQPHSTNGTSRVRWS